MSNPKRGRRDGRGRAIISVSLSMADLYTLDDLVAVEVGYWARPVSRSRMLQKCIALAYAAHRGHDVRVGLPGQARPAVGITNGGSSNG